MANGEAGSDPSGSDPLSFRMTLAVSIDDKEDAIMFPAHLPRRYPGHRHHVPRRRLAGPTRRQDHSDHLSVPARQRRRHALARGRRLDAEEARPQRDRGEPRRRRRHHRHPQRRVIRRGRLHPARRPVRDRDHDPAVQSRHRLRRPQGPEGDLASRQPGSGARRRARAPRQDAEGHDRGRAQGPLERAPTERRARARACI